MVKLSLVLEGFMLRRQGNSGMKRQEGWQPPKSTTIFSKTMPGWLGRIVSSTISRQHTGACFQTRLARLAMVTHRTTWKARSGNPSQAGPLCLSVSTRLSDSFSPVPYKLLYDGAKVSIFWQPSKDFAKYDYPNSRKKALQELLCHLTS